MGFHIIDRETWGRTEAFHHYSSEVPCTYSVCVNLDITTFMKTVRDRKLKFFPVVLYGISRMVNSHREFRMALDNEGNIGYYDRTDPCFTVFHAARESFSNVWTEYSDDFKTFYSNYLADMELYGDGKTVKSKPLQGNHTFDVSCIPWVSFTGFNLNVQNGYGYFPPIFTIGKYYEEDEKILLPLAVQVHHAVCDGFHTARLINELQEWLNRFTG